MNRSHLLTIGGAALLANPAPARADGPLTLHAASSSNDEVTPFLYAMESGMFKRAGIDAACYRLASGSAIVAGVIGGSIDVGKSSLPSLLAAHGKGIPLTLLAPAGEWDASHPTFAIVVKSDSPLQSGADLNGKTAAVTALDDLYTIAMKTWIDTHGGDSSTVKLVETPMGTIGDTVASGRVVCGTLTEPFLKAGLDSGKVKVLAYSGSSVGQHFTMTAWFAREDWPKKNPQLAAAFVRVLHDAAVYSNGHHAETLPMLAKFLSLQPQDVSALGTRVQLGTSLTPQLLKPLLDAAARYNKLAAVDARDIISPVAIR